jgi:acetyltransferase-like isoleucine patch superfamily enzyme
MLKSDEFLKGFSQIEGNVQVFRHALVLRPEVISLSDGVRIDDFARIEGGQGLEIGRCVHISSFSSIFGGGRCIVGDFAGLAQGSRVVTGSEQIDAAMSAAAPPELRHVETTTVILDHLCFVGTNAVVLPGVTVGFGAVVAAGAVVNRNIPRWEIWAGVPARRVSARNPDELRARGVPVDELSPLADGP